MIALVPALLVPMMVVTATDARLTASPASVAAGDTVVVAGSGFPKNTTGTITFDGAQTGVAYRADVRGTFSLTVGVPAGAAVGNHTLAATTVAGRPSRKSSKSVVVVMASVPLTVVAASPTVNPIPTSSLTATPSPTRTATPTATATATPVPTTAAPPSASASASPTPAFASATPLVSYQPSLPLRAAFYYPWFPEAWTQKGIYPFTHYHPSLGYYDGGSLAVERAHIAAMQYGKIQAGIASWWGQGTMTDARVPAILSAAAGTTFRWSLYYEAESLGDPSVTQINADLAYIRGHYAADPSYLRIDGRFVVFVYADGSDGCAMAQRWHDANTVGAYVVLKVFNGYRTCASQPDGWHQYAPAVAADSQSGYSYAISPGFFLATDSAPRLVRDLTAWNASIRAMVASGAPFQLVTTFNEWGEGTSVESATDWASGSGYGAYLDALHTNGVTVSTP